ncbi:hypothetical protein [Pararhodonellum marinum]|uniref:hypothetical protein n=1 Tax=Pararhodonellum marinum TaxID=2755358 RepID=UPI00188FF582|nr:hypothetical protein [Pararhodonellum marinum]
MKTRKNFWFLLLPFLVLNACGSDDSQTPPTFNFYGIYQLESLTAITEGDFTNDGVVSRDLLEQVLSSQTLSDQTLFINPGNPDSFNMPLLVGAVQTTQGDGTPVIRFTERTISILVEYEVDSGEFVLVNQPSDVNTLQSIEKITRDALGTIVVETVQELYDFDTKAWLSVPLVYLFVR